MRGEREEEREGDGGSEQGKERGNKSGIKEQMRETDRQTERYQPTIICLPLTSKQTFEDCPVSVITDTSSE